VAGVECFFGEIWTVNADGSGATELPSGAAQPFFGQAVWSPDGAKIAFGSETGTPGIYTMNADGSDPTLFAAGVDPDWGVPFSPNVQPPGAPSARFYAPSRLTAGSAPVVPVRVQWTPSATAGVTYQLQEQVNGGSWTTIYTGTKPQFTTHLAFGHAYDLQVQATEGGTGSAWQAGASFTVLGLQQSTFSTAGTWNSASNTKLWGGTEIATKAAGAAASATFTSSAFALIGTMGAGNGSAKLYVDGTLDSTLNEHAASTSYRDIVGSWSSASTGTHTIKIVNSATSGHQRFDLDGLVIFQ
jgi:hypothetical protein